MSPAKRGLLGDVLGGVVGGVETIVPFLVDHTQPPRASPTPPTPPPAHPNPPAHPDPPTHPDPPAHPNPPPSAPGPTQPAGGPGDPPPSSPPNSQPPGPPVPSPGNPNPTQQQPQPGQPAPSSSSIPSHGVVHNNPGSNSGTSSQTSKDSFSSSTSTTSAVSAPSVTNPGSSSLSTGTTTPTPLNGSNGVGGGGNEDPGTSAITSHHKGLPPVAIGLISAALVLIALFGTVFAVRRVYQRRRADRRTRWAPVMAQTGGPALDGSSSVRSSFATTFDYGLRAQSPIPGASAPPVPPVPHVAEPKRISAGSDQSQWLVVDRPKSSEDLLGGAALLTPLSVRPFSPSESYKFPQPPRSSSPDANPFTDAASPVSPTGGANLVIAKGFSVTIKRPFAPSLPDEMYVTSGQVVVIEEMFDDGWNLVRSTDGARGLVPLACFEETDQPKGKRRSSLMESLK